jgi:hypothetical protein
MDFSEGNVLMSDLKVRLPEFIYQLCILRPSSGVLYAYPKIDCYKELGLCGFISAQMAMAELVRKDKFDPSSTPIHVENMFYVSTFEPIQIFFEYRHGAKDLDLIAKSIAQLFLKHYNNRDLTHWNGDKTQFDHFTEVLEKEFHYIEPDAAANEMHRIWAENGKFQVSFFDGDPYPAIVDTGLNISIIPPKIIQELAASPTGFVTYTMAGGETLIKPSFFLGAYLSGHFIPITGIEMDYPQLVLGRDFLSRCKYVFDGYTQEEYIEVKKEI